MPLRTFDDPTSDAARQALLDNRSGRAHPKRHRTLKRIKALGKAKREKIKHKVAALAKERRQYLEASRAYWAGLAEGHP